MARLQVILQSTFCGKWSNVQDVERLQDKNVGFITLICWVVVAKAGLTFPQRWADHALSVPILQQISKATECHASHFLAIKLAWRTFATLGQGLAWGGSRESSPQSAVNICQHEHGTNMMRMTGESRSGKKNMKHRHPFVMTFFTQIPTSSKPGQTVNLREQFVQAKGRASTRSAKFPSMFHLSLVAPMAWPRRRIVVVHHFLSNSKANEVWRTFLHPELHPEHVWSPHHSLQEPELFLQIKVQRNCQIAVASVYAQTPRLPGGGSKKIN